MGRLQSENMDAEYELLDFIFDIPEDTCFELPIEDYMDLQEGSCMEIIEENDLRILEENYPEGNESKHMESLVEYSVEIAQDGIKDTSECESADDRSPEYSEQGNCDGEGALNEAANPTKRRKVKSRELVDCPPEKAKRGRPKLKPLSKHMTRKRREVCWICAFFFERRG